MSQILVFDAVSVAFDISNSGVLAQVKAIEEVTFAFEDGKFFVFGNIERGYAVVRTFKCGDGAFYHHGLRCKRECVRAGEICGFGNAGNLDIVGSLDVEFYIFADGA